MNRRDFIATTAAASLVPQLPFASEKLENAALGHVGHSGEIGKSWNYIVYCYERGQGEWTFSQNIRGSFAYQREYAMEYDGHYCGWMDGGKLHFETFEKTQDFVEMHVRAKDDTNLIDSVYDIYYVDWDNLDFGNVSKCHC